MAQDLKINITNPEAITYITEEIGYTVLGGIMYKPVKLTHLGRSKLTHLLAGEQGAVLMG